MNHDHIFVPQAPDFSWVNSYLGSGLASSKVYQIDKEVVNHKLDQNECPWDWPLSAKDEVLKQLRDMAWNRYPEAFSRELQELIAQYYKVPTDNVLIGPGSNHICTLALAAFGRFLKGQVVVARPSFPLYESYPKSMDIPFKTWDLDENLEYDESKLPPMPPGSFLMFASPNNPVGNHLSYERLENLLKAHPQTIICADEAYFEYDSKPYTPLLERYPNLLIIRTFSKTLSAAGLRIGLAIGHRYLLDQMQKLLLPFSINHFSLCAARVALTSPQMKTFFAESISNLLLERTFVFNELGKLADTSKRFTTKESYANFFLLRFFDDERRAQVYRGLIERSVLLRDISKGPGLAGCLRVSLGTREQNELFLKSLGELLT